MQEGSLEKWDTEMWARAKVGCTCVYMCVHVYVCLWSRVGRQLISKLGGNVDPVGMARQRRVSLAQNPNWIPGS
jgi:hypothetical protein